MNITTGIQTIPLLHIAFFLAAFACACVTAACDEAATGAAPTSAATAKPPDTYLLDGKVLMDTRRRVRAGDPALAGPIQILRRDADRHMRAKLWSVTDKPFAAPSGDKHDYVSLASYFWPDPNSPNGLPYVGRDGYLNPEVREYDRYRLEGMAQAVHTLALAWYFTGEETYGLRAATQLRTWFLDETTRMTPHLRHAQMVRGKNDGSSFGLIETTELTRVVDAAGLLAGSALWPGEDQRRLQEWFAQYLQWLQTSDLGQREARSPQNHGTLYDVQTADFALFLARKELAREIIDGAKARRIVTQIEPDGSQPRELARTKAFSYSTLNLTGMFYLARLGEHVGVDLWSYRTADGRSIRGALDWLVPFATGEKPWAHQQITKPPYGQMVYLLRHAAAAYQEPAYEQAIGRLPGVQRDILLADLLYPAATRPTTSTSR